MCAVKILPVLTFHANYEQVTRFLGNLVEISTSKFFKDYESHSPYPYPCATLLSLKNLLVPINTKWHWKSC